MTEEALSSHIENLGKAIDAQVAGPANGFTQSESRIIQRVLIEHAARDPQLRIHDHPNRGENEMFTSKTLETVRARFRRVMRGNGPLKRAILEALKREGIPAEKVELLAKHPSLLHPRSLSIGQLEALIERRDRLAGYLEVRRAFKAQSTKGPLEGPEQVQRLLELLIKNIDSLPITNERKATMLRAFKAMHSDLRHGVRDPKKLRIHADCAKHVKDLTRIFNTRSIKWNELAKAVYPNLAHLHSITPARKKYSDHLAWSNSSYNRDIETALVEERIRRETWLSS